MQCCYNKLTPIRRCLGNESVFLPMAHSHPHEHRHHDHGHGDHHHYARLLGIVFALTCIYLVVEIVGGVASGSLALLADGFHMVADTAAIGMSFLASWLAHHPAPREKTFGYQRVEILAAFFNALLLLAMGVFILWEALERMQHPHFIKPGLMMGIATGGLLVNIISAWVLHGDHHENLNLKAAYFHILGDLLGSVGAMTAGWMIWAYHWAGADVLVSALIAALIIKGGVSLLRESGAILLEGCPPHLNPNEIKDSILKQGGIERVHKLHIWNINLKQTVLTAHLEVHPEAFCGKTLNDIQLRLKEEFGISHATLQMEQVHLHSH